MSDNVPSPYSLPYIGSACAISNVFENESYSLETVRAHSHRAKAHAKVKNDQRTSKGDQRKNSNI